VEEVWCACCAPRAWLRSGSNRRLRVPHTLGLALVVRKRRGAAAGEWCCFFACRRVIPRTRQRVRYVSGEVAASLERPPARTTCLPLSSLSRLPA